MNKVKRRKFPLMILIVTFLLEAIAVSACLVVYFVHSGKIITTDIERYTKNYSIALAEALSEAVRKAYKENKPLLLQDLFYNRINNKEIIDEAFFVLNNGKILLHSQKTNSERLGGNISNDEFAYNIEMILAPSLQNTKETLFANYNVIGMKNPFNFDPRVKKLLKQYIYSGIDSTGWLTSKAVFYKDKPIGAVSFIINKQKAFDAITDRFKEIKEYWKYGMAGSAVFSFLITLIVALSAKRYTKPTTVKEARRDIEKHAAEGIAHDSFAANKIGRLNEKNTSSEFSSIFSHGKETAEEELEDGFITIDISDKTEDMLELGEGDIWELESGKILDAIPVINKTSW